jgi:hypothetical protein
MAPLGSLVASYRAEKGSLPLLAWRLMPAVANHPKILMIKIKWLFGWDSFPQDFIGKATSCVKSAHIHALNNTYTGIQ